jgi:hypothetical protein
MVSVCRKRFKGNRHRLPFLTTAGGMVFGMAGFIAGTHKCPPKRAVRQCISTTKMARLQFSGSTVVCQSMGIWSASLDRRMAVNGTGAAPLVEEFRLLPNV